MSNFNVSNGRSSRAGSVWLRQFIGFGCALGSLVVVGLFAFMAYQLFTTIVNVNAGEPDASAVVLEPTRPAPPTLAPDLVAPADQSEDVTTEVEDQLPVSDNEVEQSAILGGGSGLIAYTSNEAGNFDIFTSRPDGTGKQQLTTSWFGDWRPIWSPDGQKIAFHSKRDGNWEIYLMGLDGSNKVNLSNNSADDSFPSWSPDGTQIIFHSNRGRDYDLYVMNSDGSDLQELLDTPSNEYEPAWSPDGTQIAFSRQTGGGREIFLYELDGGRETQLTNSPGNNFAPMWSPDGTQFVFYSDRDGNSEIYRMDASGSNQVRLTNNNLGDFYPSWSPDGKWITYHTNIERIDNGNRNIVMISADQLLEDTLTDLPTQERMPAWQP